MRKDGLEYLTQKERAALREFIACLQTEYRDQVRRVVLFGSKARGNFEVESDLDIFVLVTSNDWHLHDRMITVSAPISIKYDTLISPKIIGPELYQKMQGLKSNLLSNVRKEGVLLWTNPRATRFTKTLPTRAMN